MDYISRSSKKRYERRDIIIKPADKNLGVTVLNRDWYITTALSTKYLGDTNTYQPISQPPSIESIIEDLDSICKKQDWLSDTKTAKLYKDFLSDFLRDLIKICRIYFMPKLHKIGDLALALYALVRDGLRTGLQSTST